MTSGTWTSPGPSTCRCGWSCVRIRRRPGSRPPTTVRTSTPVHWTAWARLKPSKGHRGVGRRKSGASRGELPPAGLADLASALLGHAPIPIIHCPTCGEVPVPEDQLPVELPDPAGLDLQPKGTSPLGAASEWLNVDCPRCGGPAKTRLRHHGHLCGLVVVLPAFPGSTPFRTRRSIRSKRVTGCPSISMSAA